MPCRPTSIRSIISGVHCQVSTRMMVNLAVAGEVTQATAGSPRASSMSLIGPNPSLNTIRPMMKPTAMGLTIIGSRNSTRIKRCSRSPRLSATASARPRVYWIATPPPTKMTVLISVSKSASSEKMRAQFSSPTKRSGVRRKRLTLVKVRPSEKSSGKMLRASTAVVAGEMNQRGASLVRPGDLPGRTRARSGLVVSRRAPGPRGRCGVVHLDPSGR